METGPEAMRRHRKARGLTQEALATLAAIKYNTLVSIENGRFTPGRSSVEAIDGALAADGEVLVAFGYVTDRLLSRLDALGAVVEAQGRAVRLLIQETRGRLDDEDELAARLDVLERALARQQAR